MKIRYARWGKYLAFVIGFGATLLFTGPAAQTQNVGIGTPGPATRLHVAQNNNVGHMQPAASLFRLHNQENTTCLGTQNIWDFRVGN
jgi:hypothetical protein